MSRTLSARGQKARSSLIFDTCSLTLALGIVMAVVPQTATAATFDTSTVVTLGTFDILRKVAVGSHVKGAAGADDSVRLLTAQYGYQSGGYVLLLTEKSAGKLILE
jgi:hypothetical protein